MPIHGTGGIGIRIRIGVAVWVVIRMLVRIAGIDIVAIIRCQVEMRMDRKVICMVVIWIC